MPCSDGGPSREDLIRERLDRATRVACEMEKLLTHAQRGRLSAEAVAWIEDHKARDRMRVKREQQAQEQKAARRTALQKLTERERRLLGV